MEILDLLLTIFAVAALIGFVFGTGAVLSYFQKITITMTTAGSQSAMAYKLASSPELSWHNTKDATEKFIFKKDVLDRNNNKQIPGMDFDGSYYFIEMRDIANMRTWRFSNADIKYAYNTILRGWRPADEPKIDFCGDTKKIYADYAASVGNPFNPLVTSNPRIQQTPGTVIDGDKITPVVAYWYIDPDSSYSAGDYHVKYPLCICDIECPAANGCKCSKDCTGAPAPTEIAMGQKCI